MDDIGSKLFITLREMMESPPFILKMIITNNINIADLQQSFNNTRNDKSADMNYYKNLTIIQIDTPLKSTYDTRAAIEIDNYVIEEKHKFKRVNYPTPSVPDEPISDTEIKVYEKALDKYILPLLTAFTPLTKMKYDRLFIKDYDAYEQKVADKNDASINLVKIERDLNQVNNLESVVGAYESMIATIITHIKSIVNLNEHLATLLHKKVKITSTNEEVVDPLYNGNLSGIYSILKDKYSNDSFVNLSTHLLSIFTWQLNDEHASSPELALRDMNDFISIWTRKKLWEKLTFDMFISFALLKDLPMKCPIRFNLIRDINKFIVVQETKMQTIDSSNNTIVTGNKSKSESLIIY
jgi:hypothetical protein